MMSAEMKHLLVKIPKKFLKQFSSANRILYTKKFLQ